MPSDAAERLLGEEDIQAIRQEAIAAIQQDGITRAAAARAIGVAEPTFQAWVSGTYTGRNDRIAADVRKWLNARREKAVARRAVPAAPAFVETPTAEAVMFQLRGAQQMQTIAVVVGAPGIGKTEAIRAYRRASPNVWVVTGHPSMASPRAVLDEMCRVLGLLDNRALHRTHRSIVDRLRGTGALIVVDEANHLTSAALEQIRAIFDEGGIGVALVGNATVLSRLQGAGNSRTAEFAQLFRRVGLRLTEDRAHRARLRRDIDALAGAWGVQDDKILRLLQAVGRKPGALGNVTMTLKMAHLLAAGAEEPLAPRHIEMAWHRLAETPVDMSGEAA